MLCVACEPVTARYNYHLRRERDATYYGSTPDRERTSTDLQVEPIVGGHV